MVSNNLCVEQVQNGIGQCIVTANELIDGAQYLAKRRLYELAYSLLLLASEERGKAILVYRTIILDDNDVVGWQKFWVDFRDHRIKLLAGTWQWAHNFFNLCWDTQFGKSIEDTQKKFISDFNLQKQHGMYVFFNKENGKFEKNKVNRIEYELMFMCINTYLQELVEIKKSGLFLISNLNKLKGVFTGKDGKRLILKYKKLGGLKTLPEFKNEYDLFLKRNSLCEIEKMTSMASRKTYNSIPLGRPWLKTVLNSLKMSA